MFRAISGALGLALTIVVIRVALPEIADQLIEIIVKSLSLLNNSLNSLDQNLK
ncbi:MAG: hypothetical protein PF572_05385 [Patescibacteria group bacterium]|jgi:hypothetical protein|nr:hypothetical protein [Patescibacteria group bacterium]